MKLPKVENLGFIGICIAIVLAGFFFILGMSGIMTALGIMLLFIIPMYSILDNFSLDQDEKIVFSFFLGVGIFPAIAYWLGMLISFRAAIFITFLIMVAAGFVVRVFKK